MNPKPKVVCLGEVLWDLLPSGSQLGAAPSNLACHVAALGGEATLISRVGRDDLGLKALTLLKDKGVGIDPIGIDDSAPTGTVGVDLAPDGQPRFTIHEHVAWDNLTADPTSVQAVAGADAVCFGSLGQRTPEARAAIRALVAAAPPSGLVVFDVNLRPPFYHPETLESSLKAARLLKLNDGELDILSNLFGLARSGDARAEELAQRFGLESVLLTLGAEGCKLWSDGGWTVEPGRKVQVRDTVGAGDSFTAAFILAHLHGWPAAEALRFATDIAAYVCTQSGATPVLPPALVPSFGTP